MVHGQWGHQPGRLPADVHAIMIILQLALLVFIIILGTLDQEALEKDDEAN